MQYENYQTVVALKGDGPTFHDAELVPESNIVRPIGSCYFDSPGSTERQGFSAS